MNVKETFKYLMVVAALAMGFASCSSDDDDETPAAQVVAGSYSGYSSTAFAYSSTPLVYDGESVAVTANSDGTVNVVLTSTTWGTSTISNATVTSNGSAYTLAGSGSTAITGHSGSASTYECTLAGTISADKSTYNLAFTLPSLMGGTTITFINGEAPAGQLLQGSYSGWSSFSSAYFSGMNYDGQTVKLTANEDGTVKVSYTSDDLGSSEIDGVTVEKDGENYKIAGTGTFSMGMNGSNPKDYDCELSGTISADKQTYSIAFSLPSVMGGSTITFQNGSAPATEE